MESDKCQEIEAKLKESEAQRQKKEKDFLYLYAEFENYKKRAAHEQAEAFRFGWAALALELLDVVDSLERALTYTEESEDPDLVQGLQLTLKQLHGALERHGVQRLASTGQPFDPEMHEALASEPSEEHAKGTVVGERLPGYTLHQRLLRPARVVVSSGAEDKKAG